VFFALHLRANGLEVISLEMGYHRGRLSLAYLEECACGPEDPSVVTTGPCRTTYAFLLGGAKNHRAFSAIRAFMVLLPLDKSGRPMLFVETANLSIVDTPK
jgi:hypothetical protein